MGINDVTPPVTDFSEIWEIFKFNLGSAFGFVNIIGLILLGFSVFYIWRRRGIKEAGVLAIIALPIVASAGLLPNWVTLISYIATTLFGVRLYVQATEGI